MILHAIGACVEAVFALICFRRDGADVSASRAWLCRSVIWACLRFRSAVWSPHRAPGHAIRRRRGRTPVPCPGKPGAIVVGLTAAQRSEQGRQARRRQPQLLQRTDRIHHRTRLQDPRERHRADDGIPDRVVQLDARVRVSRNPPQHSERDPDYLSRNRHSGRRTAPGSGVARPTPAARDRPRECSPRYAALMETSRPIRRDRTRAVAL